MQKGGVGIKEIIMALLVLAFFGVASSAYYNAALHKQASDQNEAQKFVVKQGEGAAQIAQRLEEEGLINSSNLFKIYLRLANLTNTLQAGEYQIPKNLNLLQIIDTLQHGTFTKKVTIIEGLRREEMAETFEEALGITQSDFLLVSQGLEGKLFPETYFFEKDVTAQDIVDKMTATFEAKVTPEIISDAKNKLISEDELLILASIVEREVNTEKDRPIVAGILVKRWLEDWPLQADATTQYAVGTAEDWWPKNITADHLNDSSPYNTRQSLGLPPTPICNPGLDSISAVSGYVETVYWYYLTGKDGTTHYAETLEEHNANIAKYL
ncbi:MAG: endolytic transglycosylase MltG [bacterium]